MSPKNLPIFDHELHLHLYGALTAEDLYELGFPVWQERRDRLEWYADTMEKATGYRPDYHCYWSSRAGLEKLRQDYEIDKPSTFERFQASFNLAIALCPIGALDEQIVERACTNQVKAGIHYAEYRIALPAYLNIWEASGYLNKMTNLFITRNKIDRYRCIHRLLISLPQTPTELATAYHYIRTWQRKTSDGQNAMVVGIDLAGAEEPYPPRDKESFFKAVTKDNSDNPSTALAVCYHVGETRQGLSLGSSARRVLEAARLGAHRIGHGVSLGLNPACLYNQSDFRSPVQENIRERSDHLNFISELLPRYPKLHDHFPRATLQQELDSLAKCKRDDLVSVPQGTDQIAGDQMLLEVLRAEFRSTKATIECCPTSNSLLAGTNPLADHPIKTFVQDSISVVLSTDDPGLFLSTLKSEAQICHDQVGLSVDQLTQIADHTKRATAAKVSGREPRPTIIQEY